MLDLLLQEGGECFTQSPTFHRDTTQLRLILEKLSGLGMVMGVVTSQNKPRTTSALDALKLRKLFQVVTTWGDTVRHKPHPKPLSATLESLQFNGIAIYVGDRPEDVLAAKAAGMLAVGATWFIDGESEKLLKEASPDYVVDQPSELFELVLRLKRQTWARQ